MKRLLVVLFVLWCLPVEAQVIVDAPGGGSGSSSITVGTTPIVGGATTQILYDDTNKVGESANFTYNGTLLSVINNSSATSQLALFNQTNNTGGAYAQIAASAGPQLIWGIDNDAGFITGQPADYSFLGTQSNHGFCLFTNLICRLLIDNGGLAQYSGTTFQTVHTLAAGVAAIGSGFGSSPSIAGGDEAFRVTVGSGGVATTGVVTFAVGYTTAPACVANDETTTLLVKATATTSQVTLTSATAWGAADKLTVICKGY